MIKALLALCMLASPLVAQTRAADQERLDALDEAFGRAVHGAFAYGADADTAVLARALAGPTQRKVFAGDWKCRTIKFDRTSLTVYRNFRCKITEISDSRFELKKLTGSQRLIGTISEENGGWIYRGVGFVDGGPALHYDAFPDAQAPVEPGQTVPQIGRFEPVDPQSARLLLPRPLLESEFDIIWLTR